MIFIADERAKSGTLKKLIRLGFKILDINIIEKPVVPCNFGAESRKPLLWI